jgi:hypothetical protein
MRTWFVAIVLALCAAAPARAAWHRPVPGAVARPFTYSPEAPFQAGRHRGVDLASPPGAPVRAACTGDVATALPGLVTLRCGPWRVTHLPLASVSVRARAAVRAGEVVGRLGADPAHTGLHVGVRRAGDAFAYVDPLPFLRGTPARPPVAAAPRRGVPREGPRPPSPVAAAPPVSAPLRAPPDARVRVLAPARARDLAPWPAWAGLALVLAGAAGGGVRIGLRRRRAAAGAPVPSAP